MKDRDLDIPMSEKVREALIRLHQDKFGPRSKGFMPEYIARELKAKGHPIQSKNRVSVLLYNHQQPLSYNNAHALLSVYDAYLSVKRTNEFKVWIPKENMESPIFVGTQIQTITFD